MIFRAQKAVPQPLRKLCALANVSSSCFYIWKRNPVRELSYEDTLIAREFAIGGSSYGYRTLKMRIERGYGVVLNHKRIRRSMKKQGLITVIRRKRQVYIQSEWQHKRAFPNIVLRQFSPALPRYVYSGDITEFKLKNSQKVYLHAVKDLCTKEIVSYNVGAAPSTRLVLQDFRKHLESLPKKQRKRLIYHTDQGSVFMSDAHINLTKSLKVKQSMSRRGQCLDNAPIESFFGHMKDELQVSNCNNLQEFGEAVKEYITYYNCERPQWNLNKKTPAENRSLY